MDNIVAESEDIMINNLNFGLPLDYHKPRNTSLIEDRLIIFHQGLMYMPQMLETKTLDFISAVRQTNI